jgi:hypothetical protein
MTTIYRGKTIIVPAGTFVRAQGKLSKRTNDAFVTVTRAEPARNGKTRVYWKSMGYPASALIG